MPYLLTLLMVGINIAIVFYVHPVSRYYYEQLEYELRSGALGASIKVGEFTTLDDRMALRIEESRNDGRDLGGIFARVTDDDGQVLSHFRQGRDVPCHQRQSGHHHPAPARWSDRAGQRIWTGMAAPPRASRLSRATTCRSICRASNSSAGAAMRNANISCPNCFNIGWNDNVSEAKRDASQASFNYRLVEVVIMFLMPLLAVALGIPPKRSTSALGVFVAIVMVVSYHKVNQYGEDIAALGRADPILALWGPFAVFAALIVWMYYRVAHVPGGQAIGALEAAFAKIGKAIGKLFGKRTSSADAALGKPGCCNPIPPHR